MCIEGGFPDLACVQEDATTFSKTMRYYPTQAQVLCPLVAFHLDVYHTIPVS